MITVLADPNLPDLRACLHASVRIVNYDLAAGWTADQLARADALLVRTTHKVNRTTLPSPGKVRFVGTASAGRDHIDAQWLAESGIVLADAGGSNAQSVAEYVATAMIWWSEKRSEQLSGLRVGIVGCGHTGSAVARLLGRLGCACVLYDPPREQRERVDGGGDVAGLGGADAGLGGRDAGVGGRDAGLRGRDAGAGGREQAPFRSATLEEVLACEILTLHVPLEHEGPWATWHWLDASRLGLKWADRSARVVRGGAETTGRGARAGRGQQAVDRDSETTGRGARAGRGQQAVDRGAETADSDVQPANRSAQASQVQQGQVLQEHTSPAPKKLVINASRGGVVDEQALREAAQSGLVADYICDVWEGEPNFDDHTLARALLATPHIAGYSLEAKHTATVMLAQALHHWLGLPAPRVPVPQPARSELEGGEHTAGQVLEQVHPGRWADRELRALAGLDGQAKAAGFHVLRHRTRLRREFGSLHLPGAMFDRIPELRALGFAASKDTGTSDPGPWNQKSSNPIHPSSEGSNPIHPRSEGSSPIHPDRKNTRTFHPSSEGTTPIHPKL